MSPTSPTAPWRVLISGGLALGGPQTHMLGLCRVLREAGAEVTVAAAATDWPEDALRTLRAMGVRTLSSPFGFVGARAALGKLTAFAVWPWRLRRDHDVLYCIGEGRMHLWTRRFVRRGAWTIYHEVADQPVAGSVAARVAGQMDALVANSRVVADAMRAAWPRTPVRRIPFLTSTADLPPPVRPSMPGAGHNVLRVAYLGRLVAHKRPDRLVDCWPEWSRLSPLAPARLDLYGGDYHAEMLAPLRARVAAAGLAGHIGLHGAYTAADLPGILARTDLVVLPSLFEGLPLVLVEAMARGVPVVATAAGGTAELGEGNPDVLISAGTDWDAFARAVQAMAGKLRAGEIDPPRLHRWTEARYGHAPVAARWRQALLCPGEFFIPLTDPDP